MKKSVKIISTAMAAMMAASMLTVGAASASAAKLKKPTSVKAANTSKGIKLTWKSAKGAKKYTVYRGKKALKTLKKLTYTDTTAKAGKKYTYTVRSVNGKKAAVSKSVSVYCLKAPTGVKISTIYNGLRVKWTKSKGASKYQIYRKAAGEKYKLVKTIGDKKTYTDTSVANGTKYTYKIKANKAKSTSVYSKTASKTFIAVVSNLAADITVDGNTTKTTLTWDKNDAAAKYRIQRVDSGSDTVNFVKDVTDTTFTDEFTSENPTYFTYVVIAINGSSSAKNALVVGHFPKGSYYTDKEGNVNVNLKLKKGESYNEGAQILLPLMFVSSFGEEDSLPAVEITEGSDVISTDMGIIEAKAAGEATIKVSFSAECKNVLNLYFSMIANGSFNNKLDTGVAYVHVTVTE